MFTSKQEDRPVITQGDVKIINQLEDDVVKLIRQNADSNSIVQAYGELRQFILKRFFNAPYVKSNDWFTALKRVWDTQVGVEVNFNAKMTTIRAKESIDKLRRISRLFQTMLFLQDLPNSITMRELIRLAINNTVCDNSHVVWILGDKALGELNAVVKNCDDKFHNFAIVLELLKNAVKYSPMGSEIELLFEKETCIDCYPTSKAPKSTAVYNLTITDRGIGIPVDEIGKLAQSGYRASNVVPRCDGAGFGLSAVIAHAADNRLTFKSPASCLEPNFPGTSVVVQLCHG